MSINVLSSTPIKKITRSSSKLTCLYMHKLCGADCDNHVCRAFFPEKQPLIDPKSKDICLGDEYETECLQHIDGVAYQEEKRVKGRTEKCPFAQNTRCGRPWEWWCKGSNYPFLLTTFEIREGTHDLPVRDENGDIKFTRTAEDIYETCLSGDAEIYMECPAYKDGMAAREYDRSLKN